jgi:hypothetical protein
MGLANLERYIGEGLCKIKALYDVDQDVRIIKVVSVHATYRACLVRTYDIDHVVIIVLFCYVPISGAYLLHPV